MQVSGFPLCAPEGREAREPEMNLASDPCVNREAHVGLKRRASHLIAWHEYVAQKGFVSLDTAYCSGKGPHRVVQAGCLEGVEETHPKS